MEAPGRQHQPAPPVEREEERQMSAARPPWEAGCTRDGQHGAPANLSRDEILMERQLYKNKRWVLHDVRSQTCLHIYTYIRIHPPYSA